MLVEAALELLLELFDKGQLLLCLATEAFNVGIPLADDLGLLAQALLVVGNLVGKVANSLLVVGDLGVQSLDLFFQFYETLSAFELSLKLCIRTHKSGIRLCHMLLLL